MNRKVFMLAFMFGIGFVAVAQASDDFEDVQKSEQYRQWCLNEYPLIKNQPNFIQDCVTNIAPAKFRNESVQSMPQPSPTPLPFPQSPTPIFPSKVYPTK